MFQSLNIASEGKVGRPAHMKQRTLMAERLFDSKGRELGSYTVTDGEAGSVVLTARIDGKARTITFPAVKPQARSQRPRKASSKGAKVTAARKATRKRTAKQVA